jgi:hypothetical protein
VLIPAGARSQLASAAFSTASPRAPPQQPIMRVSASRGINESSSDSPVRSSLACDPRMERERLGFSRASHPADQQPNDPRRGGDRPPSRDLEQHSRHIRRTSNLVFTRIVRPRVAPRVAGRVGITPDMPVAKSEQVPRPIRSQVREQRSALAEKASSAHGGAAQRFVCRKGQSDRDCFVGDHQHYVSAIVRRLGACTASRGGCRGSAARARRSKMGDACSQHGEASRCAGTRVLVG